MERFWSSLRRGDWLTVARLRGYSALMLAVSVAGLVGWIALSGGTIDPNGKPLGTDFSSFYTAGQLAREGHAADAYDPAKHYAVERRQFGDTTPYYAWAYPPVFFLIAAPLSALPYQVALGLWLSASLALYVGALRLIVSGIRRDGTVVGPIWILLAIAFPAVTINIGHGQNGFLTTAIFAAALAVLATHPMRSGALFALLAYKPQFALLVPFALLAAQQWRAITAGLVMLTMLLIVTTFLFGWDAWSAFAASSETSRHVLLEQGAVGYEKLQSAFAAIRLWGGSVELAYGVQIGVALVAMAGVARVWRTSQDEAARGATLVTATLLASPHVLDYDLMLLAPAMAYLAQAALQRGWLPFEITLVAFCWTIPLVARSVASATLIPLGFIATATLFALAQRDFSRRRDWRIIQPV